MSGPPETLDLLRGCPGMGAYWFRPTEPNDSFFAISFHGHRVFGCGGHVNTIRALVKDRRRHPSLPQVRLLVEVEAKTAWVVGMGPAALKREWPALLVDGLKTGYDMRGPVLGRWRPDCTPEVIVGANLPENLRAVGVERMTLGPEDARRESWVWVVEFVEKGRRRQCSGHRRGCQMTSHKEAP